MDPGAFDGSTWAGAVHLWKNMALHIMAKGKEMKGPRLPNSLQDLLRPHNKLLLCSVYSIMGFFFESLHKGVLKKLPLPVSITLSDRPFYKMEVLVILKVQTIAIYSSSWKSMSVSQRKACLSRW